MGKLVVSDQDLVLAYKCNEVIDFRTSRDWNIKDVDVDHIVNVICTEYTSEPFKEIMAGKIKIMNDYPMNKVKPVRVSDYELDLAYRFNEALERYKSNNSDYNYNKLHKTQLSSFFFGGIT